jgi:hypothetical protein
MSVARSTVRITGGLGNQLFCWAFGRSLAEIRNEEVEFHWAPSSWPYALDKFNIHVPLTTPAPNMPRYDEKTFAFDKDVYSAPGDSYFRGYWQTEKYFVPEILRREITFKDIRPEVQELGKRLSGESATFIHIRRGDYLNPGTAAFHGNLEQAGLGDGYYKAAVEYANEKITYFNPVIFSDDPLWCAQNFPFPVINGFAPHEDLYLMSQCRHGIGANSSFSWWGAWLGDHPERVNIFPQKWFTNPEIDTSDLIPNRWVRI